MKDIQNYNKIEITPVTIYVQFISVFIFYFKACDILIIKYKITLSPIIEIKYVYCYHKIKKVKSVNRISFFIKVVMCFVEE